MTDLHPEIILNEYQKAAVLDESRAVMVNACVGSGKTTVLTAKVRYLHEKKQIPYENMMVLTFTNRAADEIRERLNLPVLSDSETADPLLFGTFHSAARKLLKNSPELASYGRTPDFTILEPESELLLAETLIQENKLKIKYKNRLKKRLESEREDCLSGGSGKYKDDITKLFRLMEERKKTENQMTFTDLLDIAVRVLKERPYYPDWIIVDEVQDCNQKQVDFLKLLYGPETKFFAVGDPNQMIYSFRGSQETLFYQLKYDFQAKELTLPVNYRSTPEILALANRFRQFGSKIDGEYKNAADSAAAMKNSTRAASLEDSAEALVPEDSFDAAFPEDRRIRIYEYYDPFLEAEILSERIKKMHEAGTPCEEIAFLYRLKEQGEKLEKAFARKNIEGVRLMTVHASKGLEFDTVFLIGLNQGLFPLNQRSEGGFEEEQRLFFVGITRARKHLEITWYTNPDQIQAIGEPSVFIEQIPADLVVRRERRCDKEKMENLQKLRREVQEEIRHKTAPEPEKSALVRVRHPRYGEGILIREDDMTWEAEFPGYGKKEFMKMFEPLNVTG